METNLHYRGYLGGKCFYDKDLKYFVDAEHLYRKVTKQKCFDENRNYLGLYEKEEFISEHKTIEVEYPAYKRFVQINYKFYNLVSNYSTNLDEIERVCGELSNSFGYEFSYQGRVEEDRYDKKYNNYVLDTAELEEIIVNGHTRCIYRKLGKSFFDVDLNDYKKNLEEFIKENPSDEWEAKKLYQDNITTLCRYFLCEEKDLFKGKMINHLIKRLQRKITYKQNNLK
jgi:hypothetical protein